MNNIIETHDAQDAALTHLRDVVHALDTAVQRKAPLNVIYLLARSTLAAIDECKETEL